MEAIIAVAKIGKYATSESGDTVEIVERPGGGMSCVLVDGQMSGKSAKAISNVVTRKAISLLAEGVRDGAVARAASDYLHTYRSGKVSATLNILSIDLDSMSLVITRNNPAPVILLREDELSLLDSAAEAVGTRRSIRPVIHEVPITAGLAVIVYSDGLVHAGSRQGESLDLEALLRHLLREGPVEPQAWADHLLRQAVELDDGRPSDDISVLVAAIRAEDNDDIRKMSLRMPLK